MLAKTGDVVALNRLRRMASEAGAPLINAPEVKKQVNYSELAEKLRLNTSADIREDALQFDRMRFRGQLDYIRKNEG